MIPTEIQEKVKSFFSIRDLRFETVSGGSINEAYRFTVKNKNYFLKYNSATRFPDIIRLEVEGLKAIAETKTIAVPDIFLYEKVGEYELLILPYLPKEAPTFKLWENLADSLAAMHRLSALYYGWDNDNYIGRLRQSNTKHQNFLNFFIQERLQKQLVLANQSALLGKSENLAFELLFSRLDEIIPEACPSLVHGDLWGGNFIAGEGQTPYLIDPSIQYNFRETDIAFTHLFGGFDKRFYEAYQSNFPLASGFGERIAIYNLYPLLVHLNMFGKSYLSAIQTTLRKFS